jgi:hypothetical protein
VTPGFFRDVIPQLIRERRTGRGRSFIIRRFRFGATDACGLVSCSGHLSGLPNPNSTMRVRPKTGRTGALNPKSIIDRTVRSSYIAVLQDHSARNASRHIAG